MCRVLLVLSVVLSGCSGSEEGNRLVPCAPGEVKACSCGASQGSSTCQSNNIMGPCDCNTDVHFGGGDVAGKGDTTAGDDSAVGTSGGVDGAGSGATDGAASSRGAEDSGRGASDASGAASSGGSSTLDTSDTADADATGGAPGDGSSTAGTDSAGVSGSCDPATMVLTDLAGSGSVGKADGKGAGATFNSPRGVSWASDGSLLVADRANSLVRRVGVDGTVTTVAGKGLGSTDGALDAAKFAWPLGIFEDAGAIWVADSNNDKIRLIKAGQVTTVAGTGTQGSTDGDALTKARFYKPQAVARAPDGSLWVADTHNHRIRRIHVGQVSTLAGSSIGGQNGKGKQARFSFPKDLRFLGADALVADRHNHKIRKVAADGTVTTWAGTYKGDVDGPISSARFNQPCGVAIGKDGGVWVADRDNDKVRLIKGGMVTTVAGSSAGHANGVGVNAKLNTPWGIAISPAGVVYVGDSKNHRIRALACP